MATLISDNLDDGFVVKGVLLVYLDGITQGPKITMKKTKTKLQNRNDTAILRGCRRHTTTNREAFSVSLLYRNDAPWDP